MMITHTLGAYEDPETNELHFDVLQSVFLYFILYYFYIICIDSCQYFYIICISSWIVFLYHANFFLFLLLNISVSSVVPLISMSIVCATCKSPFQHVSITFIFLLVSVNKKSPDFEKQFSQLWQCHGLHLLHLHRQSAWRQSPPWQYD